MKKFQNKKLSVVAYANGFTLWGYDDKDLTIDEIIEKDFFADVWTLMNVGDIIMVICKNTTAQLTVSKLDKESVETRIMAVSEY